MRLALALFSLVLAAGPARAQDAGSRYAAAYTLTGFRVRALYVCPHSGSKAMAERAFAPISSPEFLRFTKAYPETTKMWMIQGADLFNTGVMQDGIDAACRKAR